LKVNSNAVIIVITRFVLARVGESAVAETIPRPWPSVFAEFGILLLLVEALAVNLRFVSVSEGNLLPIA
jgi:hypothetical protein